MTEFFNTKSLTKRRKDLRNLMPEPERLLWAKLKNKQLHGYKFRRQYSVGGTVLDFYCPKAKLGIEIDGDSHFTNQAIKRDVKRDQFIKSFGIKILRFTNLDVTQNIEAVIEKILEYLNHSF